MTPSGGEAFSRGRNGRPRWSSMHASRRAVLALLLFGIACSAARGTVARIRRPKARMEFADAVSLAARRHAAEASIVTTGGHSILLEHRRRTPRVFLLLHGFTDAPVQFATVGRHLFDTGDNVYIPRLPHHAERQLPLRALGRVRVWDLVRFGDSVLAIAEGLGDSVVVIGLSAGGTIAASLARRHASVRRAVLISPALVAGTVGEIASAAVTVAGAVLPDIRRTASADTTRPESSQGLTSRGLAHVLLLGQTVIAPGDSSAPKSPDITFLLNERDLVVSRDAALSLAQRWFDHGNRVAVYRFPISEGLPHNVMASKQDGGRPELVFPVVESLAHGYEPERGARRLAVPCHGWMCRLHQLMH